jgi:hypothetical protein
MVRNANKKQQKTLSASFNEAKQITEVKQITEA